MDLILNTLVPALVGYFFGGRGTKTAAAIAHSLRAIIEETLDEHVDRWIESAGSRVIGTARRDLEDLAWTELQRLGLKRSKAVDLVVHELVAVAYGKFRRTVKAAAERRIPRQLNELEAATQRAADAFGVGPIVPPLDIAETK